MASTEADNPAYYQYTPLPSEPGTFRLLHRPKDGATTQRRLVTANFNTASQKYTAISYVWGPPSERTTYELADGAGVVQIPISLSEALARIDDEYVWADSICINQRDDEEKAVQVQQMVDVYAHAQMRIIYLFKEEPRYFDVSTRRLTGPAILSIIRPILGHTWFTRAWIFQEAYQGAMVYCGYARRSLDDVFQALQYKINGSTIQELLRRGKREDLQAIREWLAVDMSTFPRTRIWDEYHEQAERLWESQGRTGTSPLRAAGPRPQPGGFLEEVLSSAPAAEKEAEIARAYEGLKFLDKMQAIGKRPKVGAEDNFWLLKVLQFRRGAGCFLPCDMIYAHLQLTEAREFRDMVSYTVPYSTAFHGVAECFMRMATGLGILAFVEDIPLHERQARVGQPDPDRGEDTMHYVRLASWAPNWTRFVTEEQDVYLRGLLTPGKGDGDGGSRFLDSEWKERYCTMRNFFQVDDGVIACVGRVLGYEVLEGDSETTTAVLREVGDEILAAAKLVLPKSYVRGDIAVLLADAPEAVHFVRRWGVLLDAAGAEDVVKRCLQHRLRRKFGDTARLLSLEGLQVGYYEYVGQARVPELSGERVDEILEGDGDNEIIVLK
ncbi:hypothetical protein V490_00912 [Pseudogymnoascus sp. VKM F-3557]|nr:hypothetical protein V490_00912 [Pseudogymnoascus sp. VKM F-3557]